MSLARTGWITLLATVGLAVNCGGQVETQPVDDRASVAVQVVVAAVDRVDDVIDSTGTVEPLLRVSPGTKILGRIAKVEVRVGDLVRRGALLAQLEKADLEAAAAQARAAVAMATAQMDNAGSQYRRMQELHSRGSATDKEFEDASAGHRVAQAALQQAEANLLVAEVTLGYSEIRSPVSGYVTAKHVESGDIAHPGAPLFVIEDVSRVKVVLTVPESGVVGLRAGDPARVSVPVLDQVWEAVVDRVHPSGDPRSRTFDVDLVLDNPERRLKSGMFARAALSRGTREGLFVPDSALIDRGALRGVFVVDDTDRGRLRWIRTGKTIDGKVEVLSGLRAGERYVAAPPPGFTDGTPVREG